MSIETEFIFAWYTRLQYIESDWNQYLNSWIIPNNTIKIATKFAHNEHILNTPIFWARTFSDEYLLWSHPSEYYNWNDSNTAVLFYSDYAQWTSNPWFKRLTNYPQWTEIEFEYSKTWWKYWNQTWTWNPNSWSTSKQLYIFWLNWAQWLDNRKFSWKMRYFKIRLNNVIQREMRPVKRKSDNAVWMFDITNKVFYQNLWSWSFTPWPNYS